MRILLLGHRGAGVTFTEDATTCPTQAIPTKLRILEDPQCADKLLRAMNVTNLRMTSGRVGAMSSEKPG